MCSKADFKFIFGIYNVCLKKFKRKSSIALRLCRNIRINGNAIYPVGEKKIKK